MTHLETARQIRDLVGEWLGRDYVTACGTPLYNPLPNAHVDRLGTDNYCGPYGCGNTYLLISNEQYRLMLMHGDYIVHPGQVLQQGQQIGQTANNGNSSECHDHLALENKNGRILDISKLADTANGHSVTGYLSGYDKEPTDGTISIRQEWGQLPHDVSHYDTLIAVLDCGRIGQEATLNTESGRLEALVFDCAGSEDGGVEWMTSGNYVAELDYYSRSRYPHLMGTKATLIYKE